MTRDELIEKVARSILYERYFVSDCDNYKDEKEFWDDVDEDNLYDAKSEAVAAIDTIFAALKEPTRNMKTAWDDDMSDWINEDIEDPWHPWVVMLNASPLAPNNKENKQ